MERVLLQDWVVVDIACDVSASLYASWVVFPRLAGAITHMHGYDVHSEQVRTFILLELIGDGQRHLKKMGIKMAKCAKIDQKNTVAY